jgi:UDP-N-acetylmuramate dehydrogenase
MSFKEFCLQQKIEIKQKENMKNHTTFKIGGEADYFVNVKDLAELKKVIKEAKELALPFFILGKGSNLLVCDKGIEGVVVCLTGFNEVTVCGDEIKACAGASLAQVCMKAYENGLTGLEFAYGIPGTVGGGLYMNAGAYGGEMSQVVISAEYIDEYGNTGEFGIDEMKLGYRTSIFKQNGKIITSVKFKLKKGEKAEIKSQMDDFMSRRKSKQPLEYPSAGSTFKRPEGYFAGALIEENNLKGFSVGGAMVSEKHAGFVINYDNATSNDVKELMAEIQKRVFEKNNVRLEPEVIFVGRE